MRYHVCSKLWVVLDLSKGPEFCYLRLIGGKASYALTDSFTHFLHNHDHMVLVSLIHTMSMMHRLFNFVRRTARHLNFPRLNPERCAAAYVSVLKVAQSPLSSLYPSCFLVFKKWRVQIRLTLDNAYVTQPLSSFLDTFAPLESQQPPQDSLDSVFEAHMRKKPL